MKEDYVVTCQATLINELEVYWKRDLVNTRWEVLQYCIGRFENVNEIIVDAINRLYFDGFIGA